MTSPKFELLSCRTKTKRGKVISKKDVEKFTNYKTTQVKQKAAKKRIEAEQAEHKFNRDLWATEDEKSME